MEITEVTELITHTKPDDKEIPPDIFGQINTLIDQEDFDLAQQQVVDFLEKKIFDIRLICYYTYIIFWKKGVLSLTEIFPFIEKLAEKHWDLLKPKLRLEAIFDKSLLWLYTTYLQDINSMLNSLSKKESSDFFEKSKIKPKLLDQLIESLTAHQNFLTAKWPNYESTSKYDALLISIKKLRAFCIQNQEEKEDTPTEELKENIAEEPQNCNKDQVQVNPITDGNFSSYEMEQLLKKLKIFSELIEKGETMKAAVVSNHIGQLIENFDPAVYFPNFFAPYFSLLAKHVTQLSTFWDQQESLEYKALERLYNTDIDEFSKW